MSYRHTLIASTRDYKERGGKTRGLIEYRITLWTEERLDIEEAKSRLNELLEQAYEEYTIEKPLSRFSLSYEFNEISPQVLLFGEMKRAELVRYRLERGKFRYYSSHDIF